MIRIIVSVLLFAFSVTARADAAAAAGPMDRVKSDVGAIISTLKDTSVDRETRWQRISLILYGRIDFRTMSQSILAANWQNASDEDKDKFVDYFSQYLEQVYREKIEAYTDQRVEYLNEIVAEQRAVVDTVIVAGKTKIPVTYKMINNDGDWYIYDVVIEGLSLVNNYRDTYGNKIKNEGMDGLLADIRGQLEQYRADHLLQQQAREPETSTESGDPGQ